MFHWICPECGREIPPAVKECPACDPQFAGVPAVEPALFSGVLAEPAQPPPLPLADLAPALPPPTVEQPDEAPEPIPLVAQELEEPPAEVSSALVAELPPALPDPIPQEAKQLQASQPEVSSTSAAELLAEPVLQHAEQPQASPEPAAELPEPLVEPVLQEAIRPQASQAEVCPTPSVELPAELIMQETEQPQEAQADVSPEHVAELPEPLAEPVLQETKQLQESQVEAFPQHVAEMPDTPADPVLQPAEQLRELQAEAALQPMDELPEPIPDPILQQATRLQESQAEAFTEPVADLPEPPAEPLLQPAQQLQELQSEVSPEPAAELPEPPMNPLLQLAQLLLEERGEREPALAPLRTEVEQLTTPAFSALPLLELEAPPAAAALLAAPAEEMPVAPEPSAAAVMTAPRTVPRVPLPISLASPTPLSASFGAASGKPIVDSAEIANGPVLALGPMQDYGTVALRKIQPIAPVRRILTPDAGPRITLPGPALPPPLHSLTNAGISAVIGSRPRAARKATGNWMVSSLTAALMSAAVLGVLFFAIPHFGSEPKSATPAAAIVAPDEVEAATPPPVTYPLSKSVEVTGFRFLSDAGKKPEIHYLVVNHSNTEMPPVTVYVSLRSAAAKPGQPPLCRFSFRASGLGAFEAKEMSSALDKLPRPADWQDLQAEVALGQ
jgi:hypothetical protein